MSTQCERNFETLFHRVNNAFIHQLTLNFFRECLRLPYYLLANSTELQCKIRTLQVDALDNDIDYALVDFIGVHLKPQVYEAWVDVGTNEEYVMLFARNAVRGNVKYLEYECGGGPAPECVIPGLFGAGVVETCAMVTLVDPRPWIRRFIETFEMAQRGAKVVRSVTLLHSSSPLSHAVDSLGRPRRTDAPTPQSDYIKECFGGTTLTESKAKLFVFEKECGREKNAAKKLEVFVWTVRPEHGDAQTAFLLQVVGM
ncbi:hypothetical protein AAVH_16287 [Aphelenchoides avenae]|nr:hypothetical protein AAVH_16287 [Aphelenchus avenae]